MPSQGPPTCKILEEKSKDTKEDVEEVDLAATPVESAEESENTPATTPARRRNSKKPSVVLYSLVRRSPRLQQASNGFKSPMCKDKKCLACNAKPPSISTKSIRKIRSSFCDIHEAALFDEALSKKKKAAPMGPMPSPEKGPEKALEDVNFANED